MARSSTATSTGRDESDGLPYVRPNCYDPMTGRFIARDPIPILMNLPAMLSPVPIAPGYCQRMCSSTQPTPNSFSASLLGTPVCWSHPIIP